MARPRSPICIRLRCPHCEAPANIRSSRNVTSLVRDLYIQCSDLECGHSFKAQLAITHTLSPSAKPNSRVALPYAARTIPPQNVPALEPANDIVPLAAEA